MNRTSLFTYSVCLNPIKSFPKTIPPLRPRESDLFAYDQYSYGPHEHKHSAPLKNISGLLRSPVQVTGAAATSLLCLSTNTTRVRLMSSIRIIGRRFASKFTVSDSRDSVFENPDFSPVEAENPEANRNFSYFMVGATGVLGAMGAKSTVLNFLGCWSASSEALAFSQVEVDLGAIPEGKSVIIKWRGKPIFIRHRTPVEIDEAQSVDVASLRDPQTDADRTKKPEWIVMLGICTHLGCVPLANSGEYNGWYCPCQ